MKYVKTSDGEIGVATLEVPHFYSVQTLNEEVKFYHESDITEITEDEYDDALYDIDNF